MKRKFVFLVLLIIIPVSLIAAAKKLILWVKPGAARLNVVLLLRSIGKWVAVILDSNQNGVGVSGKVIAEWGVESLLKYLHGFLKPYNFKEV